MTKGGCTVDFALRGKVIAISGGGSGIGRQVALSAAEAGAKVAICDLNAEAAAAVCGEMARPGETLALPVDVRDGDAIRAAVARVEAELGPIDGLVAAAGISRPARAEAITETAWSEVIGVN